MWSPSNQSASDRSQGGERGFSLVEVMVGMVASVLVIGSTLSMVTQHARLRKVDEELHLALVACQNNLEELRSLPFANLPSMHGVGFDVPGPNGAPGGLEPVAGDPDGLPGRFTVTVDQTTGSETIYLVTATVEWSGSIKRQSLELQTLMRPRQ